MLRRSRLAIAAAALSVSTFALVAHAGYVGLDFHKAKLKIEGSAETLGKFSGHLGKISAKEQGDKIVFTADLTHGLNMGPRDSHTRKEFKVVSPEDAKDPKKNLDPTIGQLTVSKSALKFPEDGKKVTATVPATLSIPGFKEQAVKVTYEAKREGSDYLIKSGSFTFNYRELGVPEICKVICVKPQVTVSLADQVKFREKG